jgi:hypothetical protein
MLGASHEPILLPLHRLCFGDVLYGLGQIGRGRMKDSTKWYFKFLQSLAFSLGCLWIGAYAKTAAPEWAHVPINVSVAFCFILGIASACGSLILMNDAGKKE